MHGTANTDNDDTCVTSFEYDGFDSDRALVEPDCDTIEPLVHKLITLDNTMGSWSEEMEDIGLPQGEYLAPN